MLAEKLVHQATQGRRGRAADASAMRNAGANPSPPDRLSPQLGEGFRFGECARFLRMLAEMRRRCARFVGIQGRNPQ